MDDHDGPDTEVNVQIEGNRFCTFSGGLIPPVGARVSVHKHLTSDGEFLTVQVTSHEWQIEEGPLLKVWAYTRVVESEKSE